VVQKWYRKVLEEREEKRQLEIKIRAVLKLQIIVRRKLLRSKDEHKQTLNANLEYF